MKKVKKRGIILILKKIVDEYELIKGNMNEARKQFGEHHHLVTEYQNQLDNLCNRYINVKRTDSRLNDEK